MPSEIHPPLSSIRNKILVAFILVIIVWGIFNSVLLEQALYHLLSDQELPPQVVENIAKEFTLISTGLTLAGIFVFHFIAIFFSRAIAHPIKKLIDGVI